MMTMIVSPLMSANLQRVWLVMILLWLQTARKIAKTVNLQLPWATQVKRLMILKQRMTRVTTIKTYGEKDIQTDECILVSKDEYEQLIHKASKYVDFKGDLDKIINYFLSVTNQCPVMDPAEFEKICEQIGADNIYKVLCPTMGTERMSNERKYLTKLRAMVVIYIMMYSHSQSVNLFQVTLARTLQQFGITDQGLASLRNLGIAAHPRTVKAAIQSSSTSHFDNVISFFQKAVENEHFLIFCIDDWLS